MFAPETKQKVTQDALYDMLNRVDLDWRKLQFQIAKKVVRAADSSRLRAFVVDNWIQEKNQAFASNVL